MLRYIDVTVSGCFAKLGSDKAGVAGEGNATALRISFDSTWDGYSRRIIWQDARGENPVSLLLEPPYETPIPAEPLAFAGWCGFVIEGFLDASPNQVAITARRRMEVSANLSVHTPAEPTGSQALQLLGMIDGHRGNTANPHSVTKSQVGLGSVNNTSDLNKPISTATQAALSLKASASILTAHTGSTGNPHSVSKLQVGLGNVNNTSDLNKPISTATQAALNLKVDKDSIVNNLTSGGTAVPLSAEQGKTLKGLSDTKQDILTGAACTIASDDLTASKVLVSDELGKVAASPIASVDLSDAISKKHLQNTDTGTSSHTFQIGVGAGNGAVLSSEYGKMTVLNGDGAYTADFQVNNLTVEGEASGITKAMVGLGNVNNTSDADKPVSTAQAAAVAAVQAKVDLNGFPAANLISNGDFALGTACWTAGSSTISVTDNILSCAGNGNTTPNIRQYNIIPNLLNHKIMIRARVRVTNDECKNITILLYGSSGYVVDYPLSRPKKDEWYDIIRIIDITSEPTGNNLSLWIRHDYNGTADESKIMQFQNVMCLDLTEIFGTGREPKVTALQDMLSNYTCSWFDGSVDYLLGNKQLANKVYDLQNQINERTTYGVYSGLKVSAQAAPNSTIKVSSGVVYMENGIRYFISGTAVAIEPPDELPRYDIVYIDSDGAISCQKGVPASSPVVPDVPRGGLLLADISVCTGIIEQSNICDRRKHLWTSEWYKPTFTNGWSGTARYCIDDFGWVRFHGYITGGTLTASAFQLGIGLRPAISKTFICSAVAYHNAATAKVYVNTNGGFYPYFNNTNIYMDNVCFKIGG